MTTPSTTKIKKSKWADWPWHPAAETLPLITEAEEKKMAEDIEARGLQNPLVAFEDNSEAANGAEGPFPRYRLDGRCRERALKRLGIDEVEDAPRGGLTRDRVRVVYAIQQAGYDGEKALWEVDTDPFALVRSLNVHRRHLTVEQKRQVIEDHLKAKPHASDREIGREAGVDGKTVAGVREQLANTAEVPQKSSPAERVEELLRADPSLISREAAMQAGCTERTVQKVRKALVEAGEIPPLATAPKPKADKPKADPKPKPTEEEKAAARKAAKITADVSAVAVAVEQLCNDIKAVVKNSDSLNDEQTEALRARRVQALDALRTLP